MAVLTGINGALRVGGSVVCPVRNWSLNVSRDALETTCLGREWRQYVSGLKGATGSATLLYDPEESATATLLNSIFATAGSDEISVEFVLGSAEGRQLVAASLVTGVSPSVSVGEVSSVDVQFQITGAITGQF